MKPWHFVHLLLFIRRSLGAYKLKRRNMATLKDDEAAIRALEENLAIAITSRDVDAIMKNYVPGDSFIIFDVVPRKEYRGANTYRSYWVEMFTHFAGPFKFSITELGITVGGNIGFGHSFQHVSGTDIQGSPVDRTVLVTNGYRKIDGKWLIALEHVSVPVDFKTGKLVAVTRP
jgi:ketosteroid isomerase-like protein